LIKTQFIFADSKYIQHSTETSKAKSIKTEPFGKVTIFQSILKHFISLAMISSFNFSKNHLASIDFF
jgi:hypothetical protein